MPDRVIVSVRLLRLVLIVVVAGLLLQLPRLGQGPTWGEFVSPLLIRGTAAEDYSTLESLANEADLVVVGQLINVERGRELVAIPELVDDPVAKHVAFVRFAQASLEVERILTKSGPAPTALELEMLVTERDQIADLQRSLPNERALFFLRHKSGEAGGRYYRLVNIGQGLIGSEKGVAVVPGGNASHGDSFIGALSGRDFDGVVAEIDGLIRP